MEELLSESKNRLRSVKKFWENFNAETISLERNDNFDDEKIGPFVSSIISWFDFIRPLANKPGHTKFRIGDTPVDKDALFTYAILQRIELVAFFVHAPEKYQIELAKQMYSTLRKRFMSRVKVWDLILTEPSIVDLLNLSKSKIQRYHLWDRHIVDELFTIRAGSKKFLKEMCYYPILLLMRFGGLRHSKRLDLMHKILIHVEAPLFGNLQHTDAELGRIRAWDKESIVWFKKLFRVS